MIEGLSQVWSLLLFGEKIADLDVVSVLNNVWQLLLSPFVAWGGNSPSVTFGQSDLCVVLGSVCSIILFFTMLSFIYGIFHFWARGR